MALFSENFVGCYPVSKTLKFELRPVPETKAYLDDDNCPLLAGDFERDKAYPVVKELLDKYYRYFIDICLKDKKLAPETIDEAYQAYSSHDEKTLEAVSKNFGKKWRIFSKGKLKKPVVWTNTKIFSCWIRKMTTRKRELPKPFPLC